MAVFAKRHYDLIARAIAASHRDSDDGARYQFADGLADDLTELFKADNPLFKESLWRTACALEVTESDLDEPNPAKPGKWFGRYGDGGE